MFNNKLVINDNFIKKYILLKTILFMSFKHFSKLFFSYFSENLFCITTLQVTVIKIPAIIWKHSNSKFFVTNLVNGPGKGQKTGVFINCEQIAVGWLNRVTDLRIGTFICVVPLQIADHPPCFILGEFNIYLHFKLKLVFYFKKVSQAVTGLPHTPGKKKLAWVFIY